MVAFGAGKVFQVAQEATRMSARFDVARIDGKPRTVRELFTARKYSVEYHQRDYAWTQANVSEFLDDLSGRFLDSWDEAHEREEVAFYRPYFIGPIVTDNRGGVLFLVDGQQRHTTLTLMLIYLRHLQEHRSENEQVDIKCFVASTKMGRYSFNLDVEDCRTCMEALLQGSEPIVPRGNGSVETLWARYQDIMQLFPQELKGKALPYFIDWLRERVAVVEISTTDQEVALEIFETMNDRGLRLTTTDMLKSYLLSAIRTPERIESADALWRNRVAELTGTADKGDSDFIRNWLRAKFAETIRGDKKDAVPGDFDIIGTAPHKWVRDHKEDIGLRKPGDYAALVERDFDRLSGRYLELLRALQQPLNGLEEVFYNAWNGFTLRFPLILAALSPADNDGTFQLKARMVAGRVDIFVARRIANYRNFGYKTVAYTMFNLTKDIRDLDANELADVLSKRVADMDDGWDSVENLRLNQRNGNQLRYLLARITAWLEARCGGTLAFADLVSRERKHPFEIEHIWANHPERHPEFTSEEFSDTRNRFGGLLLLPKDFNASYGDATYPDKLVHYFGQNLVARSLHTQCYQHNPTLLNLIHESDLPFSPIPGEFTVDSLRDRQLLYRSLCELVWNPANFGFEVSGQTERPATAGQQRYYGVTVRQLVDAQFLRPGQSLVGTQSAKTSTGTVTAEGRIELPGGVLCESPSTAGATALGTRSCNGWHFWQTESARGLVRLSRIRDDLLEQRRLLARGIQTADQDTSGTVNPQPGTSSGS